MSLKKKIFSNVFYFGLNWGAGIFLNFFFWFILGKTLSPNEYGIISTSLNLAIFLSTISIFGLDMTLPKLISEYEKKGKFGEIRSLIKNSLKMVGFLVLVILLIMSLLSGIITTRLKMNPTILFIALSCFVVISFHDLMKSIVFGFQKMKKILNTNLLTQSLKILSTFILVVLGFKIVGPLAAIFLAYVIGSILFFDKSWFSKKSKKVNQRWVIAEYALPAFLAALSSIIFLKGQQIILTSLKNPEATGIYAVALNICNPLIMVPALISKPVLPLLSQISINDNENKKRKRLIALLMRYHIFVALPMTVILIAFSKTIILIFSQPEFLPAVEIIPLVSLALLINGSVTMFNSNLYYIGKPKTGRNIVILRTLIFLTLAFPLTIIYSLLGMGIAFLVSTVITAILSTIYLRKYIGFKIPWKSIGKILFSSILVLIFLLFVSSFTTGLIMDIFIGCIGGIIYITCLVLLRFFVKEDLLILDFFGGKSPHLRKWVEKIEKTFSRFIGSSI